MEVQFVCGKIELEKMDDVDVITECSWCSPMHLPANAWRFCIGNID